MREKTHRKKVMGSAKVQEEVACGTDTTDNSTSEPSKETPSKVIPSVAHISLPPYSTEIHQGQFNPMNITDGGDEDQDNFF